VRRCLFSRVDEAFEGAKVRPDGRGAISSGVENYAGFYFHG